MKDNNNRRVDFPNSFLDYIPDPLVGCANYKAGLARSFDNNLAEVPPIYALLKVTDRCSSNCSYCAHAGNLDTTGEICFETMVNVLDQIAEAGVISVNFTGGEPLMRDDLSLLSQHARKRGLFPILLTNGSLIRGKIREIEAAQFGMIIVSVDSVNPEQYQKTRGINIDPVLDGIEALLEFGNNCPVISVTCVVNRHNINDLERTIEYFASRNIGVELCPYHHNGRWEEDQISPENISEYLSLVQRLKTLKGNNGGLIISLEYLDNFVDFTFKKRRIPKQFRCYSGFTTIYIDAKLNVRSCWSQGLPVAGNLTKDTLPELLNSEKMSKMRRRISKLQCERCWLLCTAEISLKWK